jgi:hypothetical protein
MQGCGHLAEQADIHLQVSSGYSWLLHTPQLATQTSFAQTHALEGEQLWLRSMEACNVQFKELNAVYSACAESMARCAQKNTDGRYRRRAAHQDGALTKRNGSSTTAFQVSFFLLDPEMQGQRAADVGFLDGLLKNVV